MMLGIGLIVLGILIVSIVSYREIKKQGRNLDRNCILSLWIINRCATRPL